MPMFEYRCRQCATVFERYSPSSHPSGQEEQACPRCASTEAERVFSVFGSLFGGSKPKGSGCGGGSTNRGFS